MKHKGTLKLETERLILRAFTIDDVDTMFGICGSDDDICKYMRWTKHKDKEETKEKVSGWINSYSNETFYLWAITLKGNNDPIGAIGLFVVNENDLRRDGKTEVQKYSWV